MNCREFENGLASFLDGKMPRADRERALRHLSECPRCREFESMMLADLDLSAMEAPAGLAGEVLERTAGSPCHRAHLLLSEQADGELDGVDSTLLRFHLEACTGCRALSSALAQLAADLPLLAHVQPDRRFVQDVLAATAPVSEPRPGMWERMAAALSRVVLRPRFALEGAYVGTAVLFLLFAAPFSPFRDVPSRALAAVRQDPREVIAERVRPVAELGKDGLGVAGSKVRGSLDSVRTGLDHRAEKAGEVTRKIGSTGAEFGERLLEGDFRGAWRQLIPEKSEDPMNQDDNDEPPEGGDSRRES